ncbi:MAG: hypothetical protein JNK43_00455, partial [Ignavibacteria bacterium]|nr:hypothetical protein [Ignavibacteria bacterium]
LEGNSTATSGTTAGVINIGTTNIVGGVGNDNNVITFNEIRDRSDATGRPTIGIFASGTVTAIQQYNNNCRISNNTIHDFFADGSANQSGITVTTGNSDWSIDSNSIYQTAARTNTITGGTTRGILVSFAATVTSNGAFKIRNNFIGGTAPGATGGDWTVNVTPSSSITHVFIPLTVSTGMIPNTITGNTIRNIDFTTVSPSANATQFAAINILQGLHNVSGNTIGSPVTTGNIKININLSTGTNATSFLAGILFGSANPCGFDFTNNSIGSISIAGSATAAIFMQVVQIQGNPVAAPLVQGNVIGSSSAANSIQTNLTGTAQFILFGIRSLASNSNNAVVNNNIIQNITDNSTNNASAEYGILMISSVGSATNLTVTNNTVGNISSNTLQPAAAFSSIGISIQNVQSPNSNISGNNIFGIRNTNAGVTGAVSAGFQTQNNLAGGTFSRNKIYDLTSASTGTGQIFGAYITSTSGWTFSNNMISLTNGETSLDQVEKLNAFNNKVGQDLQPTDFNQYAMLYRPSSNYAYDRSKEESGVQEVSGQETIYAGDPVISRNVQKKDNVNGDTKNQKQTDNTESVNAVSIMGIVDPITSNYMNLYYNSIYIGGSQTGTALNSYCYARQNTSNATLRNNLFYNARTGSGFHYAIGSGSAPTFNSNYNAFVTVDSSYVGEWAAVNQNIDQWRTATGGDANSWYAKTTQVPAAQLFTSLATGNLVINTANAPAWLVKGKGIAISSINSDYSGNSRSTSVSGGTTCIGASEFTATPPSNPVALQTAAPSSGGTTDYILFGRKIASITWGTGGTYPSSMNVNYFSGVNPLAPNVTSPARNSNSYWTVNPATGTFGGTTYDITFFYGDNETFSVTSPSTNVLLAKNDNTFWMSYPRGTGSLQSEQAGTTVKVRGLFNFSSFTLTDAGLPAERPLSPVNNATNQPTSVSLVWNKSLLATTYRVQVATDSLFTSLFLNDSTVTDSTRLVTGLAGGSTNYWWRVNGKSGSGTGAWSQVYKFTTTAVLPPAVVNLTVIPGGFYNTGNGRLNMKDTIRVYLVDSASCLRVDSAKSTVDSVTFGANISFSNANTGNYYMLVYHRNHLAV